MSVFSFPYKLAGRALLTLAFSVLAGNSLAEADATMSSGGQLPEWSSPPAWVEQVLDRHLHQNGLLYGSLLMEAGNNKWFLRRTSQKWTDLPDKAELPQPGRLRYRWGEIAHNWMTVTALQLSESGKINPSTPLRRQIGDLRILRKSPRPKIAVADLLSQSAAIPDYGDHSGFFRHILSKGDKKRWTRRRLFALIDELPLYDQPGKAAWQSKSHALLLAMVIEKQTSSSWRHHAKDLIITPLALQDTGFGLYQNHLPAGYADIDDLEDGAYERLDLLPLAQDMPGQDLAGSVFDLSRYLAWLSTSKEQPAHALRSLAGRNLDGPGTGLIIESNTDSVDGKPNDPQNQIYSLFGYQTGWQAESRHAPSGNLTVTVLTAGGHSPEISGHLLNLMRKCSCLPTLDVIRN